MWHTMFLVKFILVTKSRKKLVFKLAKRHPQRNPYLERPSSRVVYPISVCLPISFLFLTAGCLWQVEDKTMETVSPALFHCIHLIVLHCTPLSCSCALQRYGIFLYLHWTALHIVLQCSAVNWTELHMHPPLATARGLACYLRGPP